MADNTHLGIFNTGNFANDITETDFASTIARYMPNGTAPLFALTSRMGEATATNVIHGYFAKTMVFPSLTLTQDITDSATTLTVADTESLIPNQVYEIFETKEQILINQVLSPTTISVTRGVGSTAAAVDVSEDNPRAYLIGNAHEEASIRPQSVVINPVQITNLTQIFRNTWALSGTADAIRVIAGDDPSTESKRDCGAFHAAAIEQSLIFGKKFSGQRNGQPLRIMDGFISITSNLAYYPPSYSQPNVYTAGATTNSIQLENMLDPVFDQTTDPAFANKRLIFAGGTAIRTLNDIGRKNGEYQLIDGQSTWGLQFKVMKFARGEFTIIEHPLLNTNPDWKKMALVMDIANLRLAYLTGRKTQNRMFGMQGANVVPVDNGIDAVGGTLTTECTLEVRNPPAGAVIYNLTAGVADSGA